MPSHLAVSLCMNVILDSQPSLTRPAMLYHATTSIDLVLDQVEKIANDPYFTPPKAKIHQDIKAFKEQGQESKTILGEILNTSDLTPQAQHRLDFWKKKIECVDQMLDNAS